MRAVTFCAAVKQITLVAAKGFEYRRAAVKTGPCPPDRCGGARSYRGFNAVVPRVHYRGALAYQPPERYAGWVDGALQCASAGRIKGGMAVLPI